ncbi:MAG: lipopolysaccharide biosynthesis protein [Candidatus Contendobacter sp.]|nr:lipopolysaccharide biosynthesis protein [Candidatus Contendobacter sp.]MDG4558516.1 lipopolysaccharide biosynthesis protein [Candidatus Contendobacter sp.]
MSLIRNTVWSAIAAIVMSWGRFLLTILLARKLGVSEFGIFTFSQWLVDIVFLCLAFGLTGSASRFFAEFRTRYQKLVAFERWFLLRSLAVVAIVAVASPLAAIAFNGEASLKIGLLQAGWSAAAAVWALLLARAQGLQRFKLVALSNGVYIAIALSGCALLPKEGVDVSSAMLLVMVATAAAAFIMWQPLPIPPHERMKEVEGSELNHRILKIFAINIWISTLVSALVWLRGEIIIVRLELGVSELAIYSAALSLAGIATQGLMLFTGAVGPYLTETWGAGKQEKAIILCRRITDILTLMAAILSIFLILFAPELIRFTFGSAYAKAEVTLAILSLGTIGLASAAPNHLLQIRTNGVFARNANFIGIIGLFVTAIFLVNLVGIDGVAVSRALIQIGVGIFTFCFSRHLISIKSVYLNNQLKVVLVTCFVILFNSIGEYSFYLRLLEFLLITVVLIFWLRDDEGLVLSRLLCRLYVTGALVKFCIYLRKK